VPRLWSRVLRRTGVVAAAVGAAAVFAAPASASLWCDGESESYSYAGVIELRRAHGVAATLTALSVPRVQWGHVAGWVGVGGPNAGPNGEAEWIQVGYSGFYGGESKLYYEVTRPGASPRYHEVDATVTVGESHRVAVAEMRRRPNWWRVWVDRRPVSDPVYLPGSHGAWQPMAMGESWNGGQPACNSFSYRFGRVRVARRPGGAWRGIIDAYELEDRGYQVVRPSAANLIARANA
jgi:hypothetical protein